MLAQGYRDGTGFRRSLSAGALLALASSLVFAAGAWAEVAGAPGQAAPTPPSGELSYDIPVPAWLAESAASLKLEFAEGLAAELVTLGDEEMASDMTALGESANELAAVAKRIEGAMSTMGSIDSSFGIQGLSRLLTAEGAVRDTLFGFVVWHESAVGQSRKVAADLEGAVHSVAELGAAARAQAGQLSTNSRLTREALRRQDYASIVNAFAVFKRLTDELEGIAAATDEAAIELERIVWQIREGGGTLLEDEWDQVLLATSEVRRLVARIGEPLASTKAGTGLFTGMTSALDAVVDGTSVMTSAESDPAGVYHVPWTLFDKDIEIATSINEGFPSGAGAGYPQQSMARVQSLLGKMVAADRLLAERAVEYTSTEVGRAMDRLEDHYKRSAGYSEGGPERDRQQALAEVDRALRANRDLDAARSSAHAARAAFDEGRAKERLGRGSEGDALAQYRNAWVHALNAGAAAARSLGAVSSK